MKSTMRYIHLGRKICQVSDKDEWTVRTAKTIEEATPLLKVGFEFVTDMEGYKIFRKHK
jgi:hypothetical protein